MTPKQEGVKLCDTLYHSSLEVIPANRSTRALLANLEQMVCSDAEIQMKCEVISVVGRMHYMVCDHVAIFCSDDGVDRLWECLLLRVLYGIVSCEICDNTVHGILMTAL